MDKLVLTALILWALSFGGADCRSAKVQGPGAIETKIENGLETPAVTLTQEHPNASLPVNASVLTKGAEVLEVAITKVVNPNQAQVTIFVYLTNANKNKSESEKTVVGNFTLYPPDRAGKFLLNAAPALRTVAARVADSKATDVKLLFEMKRVDESKPWTPVELSIAQPKWRTAEE